MRTINRKRLNPSSALMNFVSREAALEVFREEGKTGPAATPFLMNFSGTRETTGPLSHNREKGAGFSYPSPEKKGGMSLNSLGQKAIFPRPAC
jgi:hypothetical protein